MRVLFSSTAGYGHFLPLVPLARAFADEGHNVAFATAEDFRSDVESHGLELLVACVGDTEEPVRMFFDGDAEQPARRKPRGA